MSNRWNGWTRTGVTIVISFLLLSTLVVLPDGPNGARTRSSLTLDYPDYAENQIIMGGEEVKIVSNGLFGNITLTHNATLKILGTVVINGIVKISDNASFNVSGGWVDIEPPPIGVHDNVIRIWNQGSLNIMKDSTFRVFPQPVMHEDRYLRNNASFIEVDDNAEILVEDSTFTAILPGDAVPEEERVTGGTILITGYGKFTSRRSKLNAYLNYTVSFDGTSSFVIMERWFWMSIQRYGTILVEDSEAILHEPGQTLFKPTNGNIILRNSTIYGNVRPETISTFEITNCEIHNVADQLGFTTIFEALELNDHARGTITNSRIIGEIKIGWSSTNEFLGKADCHVTFTDCTFDSEKILSYSNCTVIMDTCDFEQYPDLEITDNSVLELIDTDVRKVIVECGIHPKLVAIKENVTMILDSSHVDHVFNPDPDVIFNFHLKNGSSIGLFEMHFNEEPQNKTANIILEKGSTIFLQNTSTGVVDLVLRNSDPPSQALGENITIRERYLLQGNVILNGAPVENVDISLSLGDEVLRTLSRADGRFEFEYDARISIAGEVVKKVPSNSVIWSEYLGFWENLTVDLFEDNTIQFIFLDIEPPRIIELDWNPKSFDQQKYITVETEIEDMDSDVISEVILQYRRSDGDWENVTMFNVEGDVFRGVLPRSKIGQNMEFRIVAVDGVGNQMVGESNQIEIGEEFIIAGWVLLIILMIIIIAGLSVHIIGRLRTRGYLKRHFNGDRITLSDLKKRGVT